MKGGTSYRAIYLGGSSRKMTVPALRRLRDLARAGAAIIGPAPTASPALADDPKAFAALVAELWSGGPITKVGAGQVIASTNVDAALGGLGLKPDFQTNAPQGSVLFLHRKLDDGDVYFLTNRHGTSQAIEARFRVSGRRPEI